MDVFFDGSHGHPVLVDAVLATAVEFAATGKPAYLNVPTGLLLRGRSICSIRAAS